MIKLNNSFTLTTLKLRSNDIKSLSIEFQELNKIQSSNEFIKSIYKPISNVHFNKNRYSNIFPHSESRVKLNILENEDDSDYINANHTNIEHPGAPPFGYICMQAPLQNTVDDLWRMVWEQKVQVIVMLTEMVDQNREKCYKYWPNLGDNLLSGGLVVSTLFEEKVGAIIVRKINVFNTLEDSGYDVTQLQYSSWVDHGTPDENQLQELVTLFHIYRKQLAIMKEREHVVIHCSAGIGRTGTFLAIDILLWQIEYQMHNKIEYSVAETAVEPSSSVLVIPVKATTYEISSPTNSILQNNTTNKSSLPTIEIPTHPMIEPIIHSPLISPQSEKATVAVSNEFPTSLDNIVISVYEVVLQLRLKRPGMIQTQSQYNFVHKFILHCITKKCLINMPDN